MTHLIRLALVLLVAAVVGALPVRAQTKITVGSAGTASSALFAAQHEGFFAQRGLDVNIIMIRLNPDLPPALVGGSIDVAVMTTPTFFQAIDGGLDLVVLAGGTVTTRKLADQVVIAANGTNIHAAQDYIGRKVGVPGLGAGMHVLFRYWLDQHGVDPGKVDFVEISMPQMRDTLAARTVDAVVAVEPFASQILAGGKGYKSLTLSEEIPADKPMVLYTATRPWVEQHGKDIAAFRQSLREGLGFSTSQPDKTREDINIYAKLPPQVMKTIEISPQVLDLQPKELAWWADVMKRQHMLTKDIDANSLLIE
jgi:NitT/TauT family transport system substrate-binding protein